MTAIPSRAITYATGQLKSGMTLYRGFTFRETTGAADAVIRLWNNTSAAGVILETVQVTKSTSQRFDYGEGVWAENGIFAETVSGTVEGSVFIG